MSYVAYQAALLASLKEMREACAACFRVIARHNLASEAEDELLGAGVNKGFGLRADDLIRKVERGE